MTKNTKKFYISSALPYVNSAPHVGFALEIIQADVIARYNRSLGEEVFFLTGTDENGLKIARAAEEAGIEVGEFAERNAAKFRGLKKLLNLSFDDFIRTTEERHIKAVHELWEACKRDIYKKKYKGLYCVGCEQFYKEEELIDGLCPEHKVKPELVEEENYFFKLSKYEKQLRELIEKDKIKIIPYARKNEVLGFINKGLEDICISRSAERSRGWGIDVPGDPSQKNWCWWDAVVNYISALGYGTNDKRFQEWWQNNNNKLHVIGKGILIFHSLYWPAALLSAGLALPNKIFVHGYLTVDGQKISKSLGNAIDPCQLVKKYGADAVRYFLLREIPATKDGDFTIEKFEERYNADLAKGLGNLVARVLTMVEKYCDGKVPAIKENPDNHPLRVEEAIHNWKKTWKDIDDNVPAFQFNKALSSISEFIGEADKYIEENKPWDLAEKGKTEELNWALYGLLDAIHQLAWQTYIFIPETSLKIARALNIEKLLNKNPQNKDSWTNIKPGTKIKKLEPLFPRIDK